MNDRILKATTAFLTFTVLSSTAAFAPSDVLQVVSVALLPGEAGAAPGQVQVELKLTNNSPRIVTAYRYELVATYADGKIEKKEAAVDEVSLLANELMRQRLGAATGGPGAPPEGRPLAPGATRSLKALIPRSPQAQPPVSVAARVTMVALDDCTASGDESELLALQRSRRSQLEVISAIVSDLQAIKTHSEPAGFAHQLAAEARKTPSADPVSRVRRNLLGGVAAAVQRDPKAIEKWLASYETHLSVLKVQAVLRGDIK